MGVQNTLPCLLVGPGNQHGAALHVRALHAKVRFAILQKQGKKKWNVEKLGIPINQEDMSATLLAFSANVLAGIDLIAGNSVSVQEHLDYLAFWR